jgi:hypothetical protein
MNLARQKFNPQVNWLQARAVGETCLKSRVFDATSRDQLSVESFPNRPALQSAVPPHLFYPVPCAAEVRASSVSRLSFLLSSIIIQTVANAGEGTPISNTASLFGILLCLIPRSPTRVSTFNWSELGASQEGARLPATGLGPSFGTQPHSQRGAFPTTSPRLPGPRPKQPSTDSITSRPQPK